MKRTWSFQTPFAKTWNDTFHNERIPVDTPYYDELLKWNFNLEGMKLFLRPYDDDTPSLDLETVVRWCKKASLTDLSKDPKASIWLDDRNHISDGSISSIPHLIDQADVLLVPMLNECMDITDAERTKVVPDTSSQQPRCIPRRYSKALTLQDLYFYLREKVPLPKFNIFVYYISIVGSETQLSWTPLFDSRGGIQTDNTDWQNVALQPRS